MNNSFCALSTKIKAMHSGHLSPEDYNAMLEKHSVGEVGSYLKHTYYEPFISDMNDSSIHRGALEEHIERKFYNEYQKLFKFAGQNERKIIRFLFIKSEIDVLKIALRRIFSHERAIPGDIKNMNGEFFTFHSDIDTELLSGSKSLSDICNACRNTVFYPVLNHAVSMNADYPAICMMLDRLFFKNLWSASKKYDEKSQQEAFRRYIGTQIDYLNIMWIYRCKRYFKTPNELIYTYLIPVYYRLTDEDISNIVEAETMEETERRIKNTKYSDILNFDDNTSFIERNFKKICYVNAKKAYKLYAGTITEVFAFFDLLMIEEENIKTIIEGIRYSISPDLIKNYIYIN